jgi:hypothetical protein
MPVYHYNVNGEVVMGDNKGDKAFTAYSESRFPINIQGGIWTQAEGWEKPTNEEISPLYETTAPGVVPAQFAVGRSTPTAYNA